MSARSDKTVGIGEIELLPAPPVEAVPPEFAALPPILETVLDDLGRLYADLERSPGDARWVAWRFAEILPISLQEKQAFLESDDTRSCLQTVERVLHSG